MYLVVQHYSCIIAYTLFNKLFYYIPGISISSSCRSLMYNTWLAAIRLFFVFFFISGVFFYKRITPGETGTGHCLQAANPAHPTKFTPQQAIVFRLRTQHIPHTHTYIINYAVSTQRESTDTRASDPPDPPDPPHHESLVQSSRRGRRSRRAA